MLTILSAFSRGLRLFPVAPGLGLGLGLGLAVELLAA